MRGFLRRNPFIALGVSLPLALVAVIVAVQAISRWGAEAPSTPVLYVYQADWSLHRQVAFDVADGRLSVRRMRVDNPAVDRPLPSRALTLAVFDPRDGTQRLHDIELPAVAEGDEAVAVPLPEALSRLRLDPARVSPEGFRFETEHRSGGGLFGALFGFGGSRQRYRLVRDGTGFDVPGEPVRGLPTAFIGWVIEP